MYKICTFNSGKLSITNMAHALSEPFTNEISTPPTYFKLTNGLRPWDHALTAGESAVMRRDFSWACSLKYHTLINQIDYTHLSHSFLLACTSGLRLELVLGLVAASTVSMESMQRYTCRTHLLTCTLFLLFSFLVLRVAKGHCWQFFQVIGLSGHF